MKYRQHAVPALCAAVLAGCAGARANMTDQTVTEQTAAEVRLPFDVVPDQEDYGETYSQQSAVMITLENDRAEISGSGASFTDGTLTVSGPGTYVLSGTLNGSLHVNSPSEGTVHIILNSADITSSAGAAIHIEEADKTIITAYASSENTVTDAETYEEEDGASAAIYSEDDLIINGSGTLTVNGNYKNGVHSKDGLYILNTNLNVTAVNDAVKGKDVLYLSGSQVTVTAEGDGLCASNDSDPESGNILIDSGRVTVVSADDGIQAVSYLAITGGEINVTAGGGAGEAVSAAGGFDPFGGNMQGQNPFNGERPEMPENGFDGQMPGEFNGEMPQDGFPGQRPDGMHGGFGPGGQRPQEGMNGEMPQMPEGGFDGEVPEMPAEGFNGEMPQMPEGFNPDQTAPEQNTSSDSSSENEAKGLKADKAVYILGGSVTVDSADDAFNTDGDLTMTDGTLEIKTGDDALHADYKLLIQGGHIHVTQCKEGLEAFELTIEGGVIDLTAGDDGINASDPNAETASMQADSSSLVISGGEITLNTSGDGIDTNGSGEISGGKVTIHGPVTGAESALDHNGSFVINGGTVSAAGAAGMIELPEESSESCILSIGTSSGRIEIKDAAGNVIGSYSSQKNYSHLIFSSEDLKKGETYSVYEDGQLLEEVTLENTVTNVNFNGAGMNGNPFGGGKRPQDGQTRP
jgi:hypothetical protein